jgi:flagellar hook protein FlgE
VASFYIPLTGLSSDATALNTIANNLSNLNTTGYKDQSVNFSDFFYQQIGQTGSGNPIQQGSGVQTADIASNFTQGNVNTTGTASNMAIDGNGFFVLSSGNGNNVYTRNGNFTMNSTGGLVSQDGLSVMGYPATNGVVNTNAPLTALTIPVGQVEPPAATTSIAMTANLNSTAAVGTMVPSQITLYDSLGQSHVATINYTKTGTNTWSYSISLPAGDQTGSGTSTNTTGTLTFNSSGDLVTPAANVTGISFTGLADGAANLSFNWNLYNGSGGNSTLTQVDAASAVTATNQNGFASGEYQSFTVNSDGTVIASFSNGQQQAVGQVALASVTNDQGLKLLGNGEYATTLASGTAVAAASGTAGMGTIQGGSLEQSNVNISSEFSNLIIAQRAFEANSKAVTTFDNVAQDTIDMVH